MDLDESILTGMLHQQQSSNSLLSSSPPMSGRNSPPLTPLTSQMMLLQQQPMQQEPLELQIDYWPIVRPGEKDKSQTKGTDQGKNSIKSTFRSLQVSVNAYQCQQSNLI